MSIKKRIQVLLVFLVGIPLLLLLYESYHTSRRMLIEEMKRESLQIARLETAEMDLAFEIPRTVVEGLVRSLESVPQFRPEELQELLRRTLHETPEVYGVGVALDPEMTPLKRFAPYAVRRKGNETMVSLSYDYTQRDWYRIPLKSGRGAWINPYYGDAGEALMVTYVAPLKKNGIVIGMVAVDLDLDSLVKRLRSLKPGGGGTVCLVSKPGKILAHPGLKPIADIPDTQDKDNLIMLMKRPGLDAVKMKDPVSHRPSWLVESPLRSLSVERGGEEWSLLVSWPLEKKLAPLNSMGRRMLVLYIFLGGAALWFLNRNIESTLIRPIQKLTEQARQYSHGDYSQSIAVNHNDTPELRELSLALTSFRASAEKNIRPDESVNEDKS